MGCCPVCNQKTIPCTWVLFNVESSRYCTHKCSACKRQIKKSRWRLFDYLFSGIGDIIMVILLSFTLNFVGVDLLYAVIGALSFWTILILSVELFSPMKVIEVSHACKYPSVISSYFAIASSAIVVILVLVTFL